MHHACGTYYNDIVENYDSYSLRETKEEEVVTASQFSSEMKKEETLNNNDDIN